MSEYHGHTLSKDCWCGPTTDGYAYFKFDSVTEGAWPTAHPIQLGAVVRVPVSGLRALPLQAWNDETHEWAQAEWVPTNDPRASA